MSQTTYFKQFHVYELVKPLSPNSPLSLALLVTSDEFLYRRHQQMVSVLLLSPVPREVASEIRLKISCRSNGGAVNLRSDCYAMIDNILPMPKSNLKLVSGQEIAEVEKRELENKLKSWLGLV